MLTKISLGSVVITRTRLNLGMALLERVWLTPGYLEKETKMYFECSYPEPAQVPLGEKLKVCGFNLVKGIRQISLVSSV